MKTIVYVNVMGGPPFDYVIARLQAFGEVHVVQPEAMAKEEERQLRALVKNVEFVTKTRPGETFKDLLMDFAKKTKADLLLTFDEFYLRDVSEVAARLGLPGPGADVYKSVNKVEIYRALERFDLLKRPYVASSDLNELLSAPIPVPFVIKPSECAGSLGVFGVRNEAELHALPERLVRARMSVDKVIDTMKSNERLRSQPFIREGMLLGDAAAWFGEGTPFADYISVEGMILNGHYHPLAITQNFPLLDPFIETVSLSPTTLPLDLQQKIVGKLGPCLDSLGLSFCGTHSEIKLLPNQEFAVIETAARFAGWSIIPQIESVFGIDPVGEFVRCLLDPSYRFSLGFEQIHARRKGAAATLNLLPVTESGQAWAATVFNRTPDFSKVIHESSRTAFTPYIGLGETILPLSIYDGAWNSFGKVFLESRDIETLQEDIVGIRSSLLDLIR